MSFQVVTMLFLVNFSVSSVEFELPSGAVVTTELDSVSAAGLMTKRGLLIGGYKLTDEGNNEPYVGLIPEKDAPAQYWPIKEGYVSQFFEMNDDVYVLLSTGSSLLVKSSGLIETDLTLKPNSLVIDTQPNIIACNQGNQFKAATSRLGSCYKVNNSWDIPVYWTRTDILPQVCGNEIRVLVSSEKFKKWEIISIDHETGAEVLRKAVAQPAYTPEIDISVCQL
ncbi:hypothetical protein [Shewanella sp. OMA3-2]|uniref:hypothetical protein n=1 Tax=Shewanella sp. OMA3-2 TaxID=2908650 RepID=UPI001F3DFAAE|nr:hypothetical protein [Shewanella sp. OMA3-2]UJF22004.1 hypothetical protein L0B17_00590 [Shewanella sp. OMA3-2]